MCHSYLSAHSRAIPRELSQQEMHHQTLSWQIFCHMCSKNNLFVCLFIDLFVYLKIFISSFIHSFIYSFIRSFIIIYVFLFYICVGHTKVPHTHLWCSTWVQPQWLVGFLVGCGMFRANLVLLIFLSFSLCCPSAFSLKRGKGIHRKCLQILTA